jgi:serine protease AprX
MKVFKPTARHTFLSYVAVFCLLVLMSVGSVPTVNAQFSNGLVVKISRQLRRSSETANGNVHMIMQLDSPPTGQLNALLQRNGIRIRGNFSELGTVALDAPADLIDELATFPEVKFLSEDTPVKAFGYVTSTTGADAVRTQTTTSGGLLGLGLLATTSTTTFDGTGIGIAVVDSGIDQSHTSFANRISYSKDFTGENRTDDPYGHGTNVAGLALGFNSLYGGIAPNAKLINLRVLDSTGAGTSSSLLSALNWILANRSTYNIRVVNLSLGTPAIDSYANDPLCQAVRSLVNAGVVVLAAAGNNGKDGDGNKIYGQIHSPGNEPSAITVGASNTFRDYGSQR